MLRILEAGEGGPSPQSWSPGRLGGLTAVLLVLPRKTRSGAGNLGKPAPLLEVWLNCGEKGGGCWRWYWSGICPAGFEEFRRFCAAGGIRRSFVASAKATLERLPGGVRAAVGCPVGFRAVPSVVLPLLPLLLWFSSSIQLKAEVAIQSATATCSSLFARCLCLRSVFVR